MWKEYVIDAQLSRDGRIAFCPIDNGQVVVGMMFADSPPNDAQVVGVFHSDGQEAVETWIAENKETCKQYIPGFKS